MLKAALRAERVFIFLLDFILRADNNRFLGDKPCFFGNHHERAKLSRDWNSCPSSGFRSRVDGPLPPPHNYNVLLTRALPADAELSVLQGKAPASSHSRNAAPRAT